MMVMVLYFYVVWNGTVKVMLWLLRRLMLSRHLMNCIIVGNIVKITLALVANFREYIKSAFRRLRREEQDRKGMTQAK